MSDWKEEIRRQTGWSREIMVALRSRDEAEVYINAGLEEAIVGGKRALIQPRLDPAMLTPEWWIEHYHRDNWRGWSNLDLMHEGYAPFSSADMGRPGDRTGMDQIELHHIGQRQDSPFAELTWYQHHDYFKVLHSFDDSQINRPEFEEERRQYWMNRAKFFSY